MPAKFVRLTTGLYTFGDVTVEKRGWESTALPWTVRWVQYGAYPRIERFRTLSGAKIFAANGCDFAGLRLEDIE
jgi:hypothetical protein